MPSRYVAGVWARKYRGLSESDRNNVNQLTNARFRAATNVHRKLDPKRDRALCDEWLRLRDEVMQEGARSDAFLAKPIQSKTDFEASPAFSCTNRGTAYPGSCARSCSMSRRPSSTGTSK